MKTVYAFHPETKAYTGPHQLDETDLSPLEKNHYLVPGNCLEAAPPTAPSGMWPFADAGTWELRALPVEPEPTLEERRERLKDAATAHRWAVETGGITLAGGVQIKTAPEDQARIGQVIQGMEAQGYTDVPFKAASGWLTLTLADMKGVLMAIAAHVRACFEAERAHHEAIDALPDASAVESYDVLANWPSGQA